MKIDEAFDILEVAKTATEDELRTKYKELAFKYHPDKYKEDPNKLTQINSAYQLITDYKKNPAKYEQHASFPGNGFQYQHVNFNDIFSQFGDQFPGSSNQRQNYPPPQLHVKLTFNQSVLGEEKQIKYERYIKCDPCGGAGLERIGNGCDACDGFGRSVSSNNGMMFAKTCTKCYGKNVKKNQCNKCKGKSVLNSEVAGSVSIPPGVSNGTALRLQGAGHFVGGGMFGDAYGDVIVNISVEKDDELQLNGDDVISYMKISLLNALIGCNKDTKTIHGIKSITIPPMSKNKEEIRIDTCGVKNTKGVQRVILDVSYPENIDKLINFLKKKDKNKNANNVKL